MKYQSSNTKQVYSIDFNLSQGGMYLCPECSPLRKKNRTKVLKFYPDTGRAFCHHCETTFFPYDPHKKQKDYTIPEWKNITKLTDKSVKWFTGRMISQDTLNKMKIYSDNEFMPQFGREVEVICFPMFRDDRVVNIKYRGPEKSFKLFSGAELIWYNYNALKEAESIIIVEGEIDLLTWIENGYTNVISVPNGAGNNIEYLDNSIEHFENIDEIYLAVDNDTKGIELRDELARRIGIENCQIISFKDCKDSNEYFCKYGGIEFKELIRNAKPFPVKGLINIGSLLPEIIDLYENGIKPGFSIDNYDIDKFVTWETGRLATVSGVPGSGKSEFVDYIVARLNLLYGWKAAYFTPENYPLKIHYAKIHEKFSGLKFMKRAIDDFDTVYEYVKSNFYYILDEEDMTVDMVINAAKNLIKRYGIKILVIDPYNKLEHAFGRGESETQYISKFLDKITNLARFYNILIFLIAHPRKMDKGDIPSLYDISGSANFYNKTDYGFVVHRKRDENNLMINEVSVYWQKIKFKHLGSQGVTELKYNYNNGRFESYKKTVDQWDCSNWLTKDKIINQDGFGSEETSGDCPF